MESIPLLRSLYCTKPIRQFLKFDRFFYIFKSSGDKIFQTNIRNVENFALSECHPRGKFAIIVPGWQESCDEPWVRMLISKLMKYRGGCIICMNFAIFANERYVRLVRSFNSIAHVLHIHLLELERIGFSMKDGYLFGFSFGGRLVCEAARRVGVRAIKEIDVCDMAGPPFDIRGPIDFTLSADNVQCIHTNSGDKGTRHFSCHQNWRLGNCGFTQDAALPAPLGSHGLCPYMYVSAFENNFYAVQKPLGCPTEHPAFFWPNNFKMGYLEDRKREVLGELFAYTSPNYPFNVLKNENFNVSYYFEYDEPDELDEVISGETSTDTLRNAVSNSSTIVYN